MEVKGQEEMGEMRFAREIKESSSELWREEIKRGRKRWRHWWAGEGMEFKGAQGKVERERKRGPRACLRLEREQSGGTFRETPGEMKGGSQRQSYLERLKETAEEEDTKPPRLVEEETQGQRKRLRAGAGKTQN